MCLCRFWPQSTELQLQLSLPFPFRADWGDFVTGDVAPLSTAPAPQAPQSLRRGPHLERVCAKCLISFCLINTWDMAKATGVVCHQRREDQKVNKRPRIEEL